MLLPPKVLGPINQLATSVTVLGAVDGATVQLLVNGAAAGVPVVATGLSTAVGLGATVLQPGQQIAATQSKGGETSVPSPFPETVSAAPSATTGLPAVVFLTGLHPCIDWVWMGGTIPGAKVVVQRAGQTVGSAGAGGANVSVPIHFPTPASAGDVLEAFQTFTPAGGAPIQGPTVPSLPLVAAPPREPPAPTVQPPLECDMAVLVSGLNEGASMIVKHNADELAGWRRLRTHLRQRRASCVGGGRGRLRLNRHPVESRRPGTAAGDPSSRHHEPAAGSLHDHLGDLDYRSPGSGRLDDSRNAHGRVGRPAAEHGRPVPDPYGRVRRRSGRWCERACRVPRQHDVARRSARHRLVEHGPVGTLPALCRITGRLCRRRCDHSLPCRRGPVR